MKKVANPNFIYILTFIVPFLVYTLQWSTIYPELTSELLGFYLLTFAIAFGIGLLIEKLPGYVYKPIPTYRYNGLVLIVLYIVYALDCLYMGFVPLFAFYKGDVSYTGGLDIGIPTVHVILITFTLFYATYLFHQFISNRKWRLFLYFILSIVPFVFLQQRSNIMYVAIASTFVFVISQKRIAFKKVFRLIIAALAAIYLFGFLGNLRSANGDLTFIPRNSGVKEEFLESWIPNEFYWGYLYIGSPVANLQNNINIEQTVLPDYKDFFIFEMLPDFISKKLAERLSLTPREFNQINPFLNTGTIYAKAFSYLSWTGMFIIFFYLLFLVNLYYVVIRQSYMFGLTGLGMMFTMIALGNFDNSIRFSAYSFPLSYPFVFSVIRGLLVRQRGKNKSAQTFQLLKNGIPS